MRFEDTPTSRSHTRKSRRTGHVSKLPFDSNGSDDTAWVAATSALNEVSTRDRSLTYKKRHVRRNKGSRLKLDAREIRAGDTSSLRCCLARLVGRKVQ